MRVNIGFPVVRTDGRAYGHVITKFSGWADYHISLAMRLRPRARFASWWSSATNLKVYILPPLNLIFSQAMLKIVVYQMLIVTNVPVNSAAL